MFWKRKSKKQEGQGATDSAEGVAEDTTEETDDAVDSQDKTAKKDEAGEARKTTDESKDQEGDSEEKDESRTEDGTEAEDETRADDESESEDGEADESKNSEKSEAAKKTDIADDEDEAEEVGVTGPDSDGVTRVRTAGTFEFGDDKFEIISNTWIIEADKDGVVIIDPAHDAEAIMEAVGEREVYLVACTNGYSPHIAAALTIAEETEADVALHPREMRAWRRVHGAEHRPEIDVEGGGALDIGDLHIDVLALPGTSSGTVGYYVSQIGAVFSGDTLRKGEPGQVGDTYLDYTTQLASIGESLLTLPPDTRILPDLGPSTTVEAENKNFDNWV